MDVNSASLMIIADLLRARTGQHLGPGRMWRISGALAGVFREYDIANIDSLACLLAAPGSDKLARDVVEALLNNETYFFRDKAMFDILAERVLPQLAEKRRGQRVLKIWSAGCSSGQELYSIAMMFLSQRERWQGWNLQLIGTDISQKIIASARVGTFSQFEVQRGLTVSQMLNHFEQREDGWCPNDELRQMVTFREHNLLDRSPSESPFDLVLCRNVLLYFDPATRQQVFNRLHDAVASDGLLMLGAGETVVGQTDRFTPAKDGTGLYLPEDLHASTRRRA